MFLTYPDTVTFVKVTPSGYGDNKVVEEQECVDVIFIQDTGFSRNNTQEALEADVICFPDPSNDFIIDQHYRLEGLYILAPMFCIDDNEGWYRVTKVTVNRDHLLRNQIDNVQLLLKKTKPVPGVS